MLNDAVVSRYLDIWVPIKFGVNLSKSNKRFFFLPN